MMFASPPISTKFSLISARPRRLAILIVAPWIALGCGDDGDAAADTATDALTPPYATWAASPQDYAELLPFPGVPAPVPESVTGQTLRQSLRLSGGGDRLRVHLSNLFADVPLAIDGAAIALSQGGAAIDEASSVALTFAGAASVSVPPGQETWSDFVPFTTDVEADVAVSLYVAGSAPVATVHSLGQQTAFVAAGDALAAATLPSDDTRQSYYWLSGVEMQSASARRVVVTFGDSITDGYGSTPDANHRYPNYLSQRLTEPSLTEPFSVVNAGISGNRVLNDVIGPAGKDRFARDALGQSGVSDIVILLGINDIGFGGIVPAEEVTADAIIAGLSGMVAAANAASVRVFLATLLPFEGAMPPYYSEAAEAKRQAVNAWIRGNPLGTGVLDFDRVMASPTDPIALRPEFDSGDHLHPNDAGYEAMAQSIDLDLFE